jgi:hypothetical protein
VSPSPTFCVHLSAASDTRGRDANVVSANGLLDQASVKLTSLIFFAELLLLPAVLLFVPGFSIRCASASRGRPWIGRTRAATDCRSSLSRPKHISLITSNLAPASRYRIWVESRSPRGARSPNHPARSPSVFCSSAAAESTCEMTGRNSPAPCA